MLKSGEHGEELGPYNMIPDSEVSPCSHIISYPLYASTMEVEGDGVLFGMGRSLGMTLSYYTVFTPETLHTLQHA